jgi:hypothetical protein
VRQELLLLLLLFPLSCLLQLLNDGPLSTAMQACFIMMKRRLMDAVAPGGFLGAG